MAQPRRYPAIAETATEPRLKERGFFLFWEEIGPEPEADAPRQAAAVAHKWNTMSFDAARESLGGVF